MMFETIIALMGLAFLGGFGWCYAMLVEPSERRAESERSRRIRVQGFLTEERQHLGTPYIAKPLPADVDEALVDPFLVAHAKAVDRLFDSIAPDNRDWSKKADARVISLPETRKNRAV